MNKIKLLAVLCLIALSVQVSAKTTDLFNKEVPLTNKERMAVQKAKEWIEGNNYPFRTGEKITYLYGQGQPVAVCAPLQLCMIELGKNERVSKNGIHLGDSVRWQVSPSIGAGNKTFLIIKPVDVGLSTSLVLVTDQGSYNIKLISRLTDLTPLISFHHANAVANEWVNYYDKLDADRKEAQEKREEDQAQKRAKYLAKQRLEEIAKKQKQLEIKQKQQELALAKQRLAEQRRYEAEKTEARLRQAEQLEEQRFQNQQMMINQNRQNNQDPQQQSRLQSMNYQRSLNQANATGRQKNLANLDFNYSMSECARCPWKPVRVYNNGSQTIIEMNGMSQTEAPALLVMGDSGQQLVNYRIKGKNYIVDQVFNAAMLVAGVGKRQNKIVIIRGGAES